MMITCDTGTVATYPSKVKGHYRIQFTLRGGRSYTFVSVLKKEAAERKACELALSHPQWKDLEGYADWQPNCS